MICHNTSVNEVYMPINRGNDNDMGETETEIVLLVPEHAVSRFQREDKNSVDLCIFVGRTLHQNC